MGISTGWFGEDEITHYDEGAKATASDLIDLYIAHLAAKGDSDKHIYDVRGKLRRTFLRAEQAGKLVQKWGKRAMDAHIAARRAAGKGDYTVRDDVTCAKALLRWLWQERYFPKNLLENYDSPRVLSEVNIKQAATVEDIDSILRAINEYYRDEKRHGKRAVINGWTEGFRLRDRLFVLILADTGIRPVEATRIRVDQVEYIEAGIVKIELTKKQTKNGYERTIYLSKDTVRFAVDPWLEYRARTKYADTCQFLLCTVKGTQLNSESWSKQFATKVKYAKSLEYIAKDKKIKPYDIKCYTISTIDQVSVRASRSITGHKGNNNAVHSRYNPAYDQATLNAIEQLQEEYQNKLAHLTAAPVGKLTNLRG